MVSVRVLSDDQSVTARLNLVENLERLGIDVSDAGYIGLRGATTEEVTGAMEWHLEQLLVTDAHRLLVFVSETGTSFSLYINNVDGIRCLADSPLLDAEECLALNANAIELRSETAHTKLGLLRELVARMRS